MIYYFAYGSNMNPDRMMERGIIFKSRSFGILRDYKLSFNKISSKNPKEGYANVIVSKHSIVEGCIYEVSNSDILLLDKFEGYPKHYRREEIVVQNNSGMIKCIVYIANNSKVLEGLMPTTDYMSHILKGKDMLTESYYTNLKNIKLLDSSE